MKLYYNAKRTEIWTCSFSVYAQNIYILTFFLRIWLVTTETNKIVGNGCFILSPNFARKWIGLYFTLAYNASRNVKKVHFVQFLQTGVKWIWIQLFVQLRDKLGEFHWNKEQVEHSFVFSIVFPLLKFVAKSLKRVEWDLYWHFLLHGVRSRKDLCFLMKVD